MKTLGLIGLGKMGINIIQNMKNNNFEPIGYDIDQSKYNLLGSKEIKTANSISDLINSLSSPRYVMLLVPAGDVTEYVFNDVLLKLEKGDCIIDAGNSFYQDSIRRAKLAFDKGVEFVDCGTSGGKNGALNGSCLMVGGNNNVVTTLKPLFEAIAVQGGFLHTGPVGSGHYVKMIHNGIEYGMMQAIAEGFEILHNSKFNYDLKQISSLWNHGSIIRCWLLELLEKRLQDDPFLTSISGIMNMSGEGLWTVQEALLQGTPAPIIALSVIMRQRSLQQDTFAGKVVASLRHEFGGHEVARKR